jgi:hypothetical protein
MDRRARDRDPAAPQQAKDASQIANDDNRDFCLPEMRLGS